MLNPFRPDLHLFTETDLEKLRNVRLKNYNMEEKNGRDSVEKKVLDRRLFQVIVRFRGYAENRSFDKP